MSGEQLFCGTALARRIERAEMQLIVAATEAARARGATGRVLPIAGGAACFADAGSPMNKVVGLGFGGVPDEATLDEVERMYAQFEAPVPVEVSNLADPEIGALLCDRGYRLVGFENVLGRSLSDDLEAVSAEVDVRPIAADELDAWVDVVVEGFAHPDEEGVPAHEEFPRDIVARAISDCEKSGATAYIAHYGGAIAGGGSVRLTNGIAQLAGAATAPPYRRRGVQSTLLATRLRDAASAGCDVAVVTTAPGSTSQKNVQRKDFQLLYTRAILVKSRA